MAPGKGPYKRKRKGKRRPVRSRIAAWYLKQGESPVIERSAAGWAGEGGWRKWLEREGKRDE